jgi:hypothetical protein
VLNAKKKGAKKSKGAKIENLAKPQGNSSTR